MAIKVKSLDFSSSVVVEVEDTRGQLSRIEFKRKLARDQKLEIADVNKVVDSLPESEKGEYWARYVYDQILSIDGLRQDGVPITIEMIKEGAVFGPVLVLIQKCYLAAVQQDNDEIEKKDLEIAV